MKKPRLALGVLCALLLFFFLVSDGRGITYGQETTPTTTPSPTPTGGSPEELSSLKNQISDLENKISGLKSQEKTLSSQISVMDSQIALTQLRINATKQELIQLNDDIDVASDKIVHLESSLEGITKVLLNRIVATYQVGSVQPMQVLLTSNTMEDFVKRANYLRLAQQHDKRLLYDTQQAKNDYQNQKTIFEGKKQRVVALQTQLEDYTKELDKEKQQKKSLLAETQGSEANYQRLLNQARAQLEGFSRFTASQGGASLLGNQTSCDDWGCYYNQRDSQWGGLALNNTGYTLASDGCLVTSMAMVYTHYGHKGVTPVTINSNPDNFASYYPAWLKKTIIADGTSSSRITTQLDSHLSTGHPVIVGISYDGGPLADHFLVIVDGSNGNYRMHDPFTPNARYMNFTDKYTVSSIREIERVQM